MASQERFGYEWDTYDGMTPEYEAQFRNWTGPLSEADWKGKRVLDAGCGMGRNSVWPLAWGAESLVAFDFDDRSIAAAKRTLAKFPNATVEKHDIHDLPWKDEFDIAFSIGVIHHLENPKQALAEMVDALKPGGTLLVWVYSREGFEWIPDYVGPIRRVITSKLPALIVRMLAYVCSIPLFVFLKFFRPSPYLRQLATFKFWHLHSIVFDQLLPKIAHYWTKDEIRVLAEGLPLESTQLVHPGNECGWILVGRKNSHGSSSVVSTAPQNVPPTKKVNLGCAGYPMEGYINVDWLSSLRPDVVHDLNAFPYPFENSSLDEVHASHVVEHLDRPFAVMKEIHRILKPGGLLILKVPHFSRGFTHAEHAHGFDVSFPLYFNRNFTRSGYFGVDFRLEKMELHWMAFFYVLAEIGYPAWLISMLRALSEMISFLANLSPAFASRVWCFWVGGFEEIEFRFVAEKGE